MLATFPASDGQRAAAPDADVVRAAPVAVSALFERCPFDAHGFQVELRRRVGSHPPAAVLWRAEVPVALLLEEILFVSRTAPRLIRERLVGAARLHFVGHQRVRERQLWLLLPRPPD